MVNETFKDNLAMALKCACHQGGEQLGIWGDVAELVPQPAQGVVGCGPVPVDRTTRVAQLERENRELRRANQIVRSAASFFAAELDRPSR